ncbi:pyrophosphatase [Psychrobacter immobilis]|uniref:pyrophosphatase n=1 Tax=Psychrobacter immobilis TaxID=498 RepID=UPI00191B5777|nr:pyrophosphatase [Psychrobacter immobilis]
MIKNHSVSLNKYMKLVEETNKFAADKMLFGAQMGLFSEVGSLVSLLKKKLLSSASNDHSDEQVIEEMGDIFWYFTLIIISENIKIWELFSDANSSNKQQGELIITGVNNKPFVEVSSTNITENKQLLFVNLIGRTVAISKEPNLESSKDFLNAYLEIMSFLNLNLLEIVEKNIYKIRNRFIPIEELELPLLSFDADFNKDEQLPVDFEVHIVRKANGKAYLKWNDVYIGSALNDNHQDGDNYKYHDVFHLAFVAILHWSPTFRALIKHKRKSVAFIDETQDSGRPIVIEEGLSAWLFSMSKEKGVDFTKESSVSYDLLKTIQVFVRGYEVEECPLQLWVKAITQGYRVFNQVVENEGGVIIGSRKKRTLEFKKLDEN